MLPFYKHACINQSQGVTSFSRNFPYPLVSVIYIRSRSVVWMEALHGVPNAAGWKYHGDDDSFGCCGLVYRGSLPAWDLYALDKGKRDIGKSTCNMVSGA
ncbi:predicted protein [Lichtheimia corymbifera JMRC:FSU:9682]|uniref:Uncharacterized protein n=1 Tax=Lichtheimia corymbifera JMRC:FSU:9682 TaxID=1263082 RepID=A0A068SG94_9FUNG|nr:predicted protein [Lichtheimia corymbifera JMRC:FSU:9682]